MKIPFIPSKLWLDAHNFKNNSNKANYPYCIDYLPESNSWKFYAVGQGGRIYSNLAEKDVIIRILNNERLKNTAKSAVRDEFYSNFKDSGADSRKKAKAVFKEYGRGYSDAEYFRANILNDIDNSNLNSRAKPNNSDFDLHLQTVKKVSKLIFKGV